MKVLDFSFCNLGDLNFSCLGSAISYSNICSLNLAENKISDGLYFFFERINNYKKKISLEYLNIQGNNNINVNSLEYFFLPFLKD